MVIIKKQFFIKKLGEVSRETIEINLPEQQRILNSTVTAFCCRLVSSLFPGGSHEVSGVDMMHAICNAILSIEVRLVILWKEDRLVNESGSPADLDSLLCFFGDTGHQYETYLRNELKWSRKGRHHDLPNK